ncbi:hypothetical protein JRQ81_003780 [Phrynocephalus forsythii]|uniref:Microtubule-associated proteins 1A/1B light chain 3C n=1 Tax=Phrynocephalus forsythii TaxID=171643 RepID=A0A9Q0XMQ3_9SAUR|nr:hypothetical protein JRQ81_003780 [Phrynocephalus forsythii]
MRPPMAKPDRLQLLELYFLSLPEPAANHSASGKPHPSPEQVVVERYRKEKSLPRLDRIKFLVSEDISVSQFIFTLRTRLSLTATQAFYLLVDNKSLPCLSLTVAEVYRDNKDEDGFLYLTYASQEMFGQGGFSKDS